MFVDKGGVMEDLRKMMFGKKPLTDPEFEAVREWYSAHKDELGGAFKEGLEKLINNEMKDRMKLNT